MDSFPLNVLKIFRGEQGQVENLEEYQPLANDSGVPEVAPTGTNEHTSKPETREGDLLAEWTAYVKPLPIFYPELP